MKNILLNQIIAQCRKKFIENQNCPQNLQQRFSEQCQECLRKSHFEDLTPSYQCPRSAFVYVCKYANKYASENYLLFQKCFELFPNKSPKIVSFGAGPATELFALNQLVLDQTIDSYSYIGVDNNRNWIPIMLLIKEYHRKIKNENEKIQFFMKEISKSLGKNSCFDNVDIILFNYVISDFSKYATKDVVKNFLLALKKKLWDNKNVILLFNDINLNFPSDPAKGATHLLKDVFEPTYKRAFSQFFKNEKNSDEQQFSYEGTEINKNNKLIFETCQETTGFNPYETMSAIQIILKR